MKKIKVILGNRSYSIIIAAGLLNDPISFLPLESKNQAMLVTNETVATLYLDLVSKTLEKAGVKVDSVILPDGEEYKNLVTLNNVFTALLQKSYHRDATLIALGGGVIGDLVGFAAASYQRGICFIQIPTTLLSQVDSSVGGKTAVNHLLGKNMIGAFHQPISVIIDLDCLKTLPTREFISGLAEVIKYGISFDEKFFLWLEENVDALLSLDNEALRHCIYHCCQLKAQIVSADEYENNLRFLLNLGHTYGHAIETGIGYGKWLHGEAVSVGVAMALRTSERLGQLSKEETQRVITLLKRVGLPVVLPKGMSKRTYLYHIMRDKKMSSRDLRLVLPISIGKSKVFNGISRDILLDVFDDFQ